MKRLVGGEYLLDLSSIELEESEDGSTKTNITDADVLAQLTNLKKYVKNPEMAKPVWVKLKNGENDELVIARGTFAVVDTGEFEICVQLDGYKLVIYIEFTQVTLDDNTPIDDWFIDTNDAKYLFTSDAQNIGAISELPVFENIVDAQGHKRFQEWNLNLKSALPEGVTKEYGKASLSGTHLLIVLAIKIPNETVVSGQYLTEFALPEWIINKIVVWYGNQVRSGTFQARASNGSSQSIYGSLRKTTGNYLGIYLDSEFTASAERIAIFNFDLLIDNE